MAYNVPAHACTAKTESGCFNPHGVTSVAAPAPENKIKEPTRLVFFGGDSNMQVAHCKNKTLVLTQLGLSQLQLPILSHA